MSVPDLTNWSVDHLNDRLAEIDASDPELEIPAQPLRQAILDQLHAEAAESERVARLLVVPHGAPTLHRLAATSRKAVLRWAARRRLAQIAPLTPTMVVALEYYAQVEMTGGHDWTRRAPAVGTRVALIDRGLLTVSAGTEHRLTRFGRSAAARWLPAYAAWLDTKAAGSAPERGSDGRD